MQPPELIVKPNRVDSPTFPPQTLMELKESDRIAKYYALNLSNPDALERDYLLRDAAWHAAKIAERNRVSENNTRWRKGNADGNAAEYNGQLALER